MQRPRERIVVGVDGSDFSLVAARWALREAHRTVRTLVLVCAWEGIAHSPGYPPFETVFVRRAREAAQAALSEVLRRLELLPEAAGVTIETRLLEGPAGPALVAEAADAELLVVGCHGRGAISRAVLGSVSTYCIHHARCSTVVVPRIPTDA